MNMRGIRLIACWLVVCFAAAQIFEARLLFFLNCSLAAPDPAGPESKVPGIADMCTRMMDLVVFEDSALAVEMAGAALISLNIIDPEKTVLNSAGDAKRENRQALMEASYKLINRAEHDARAALSEDQRRKLEWASLVWIQNVVDQHRMSALDLCCVVHHLLPLRW